MKIKLLFLFIIILCGCRCELKIDSKQYRNSENTDYLEQVEVDEAAMIGFTNVVITQ